MTGSSLEWMARPALIGGALGLGGFLLFSIASALTPTSPSVAPMDLASPPKPTASTESPPATPRAAIRPFRNCTEARAAGHAPVYADDPAYGPWLDGDDDGIGCEPYSGR